MKNPSVFRQDPPVLGNQLNEDNYLKDNLERVLPKEFHTEIFGDLTRFGERVIKELPEYVEDALQNVPVHIPYDPWGNRIDEIKTAHGWRTLDKVSAEEGIVAIGYERRFKAYSRYYQMAKLYLFNPSSATYSCPLAMTDGAARLIEVHGDDSLKQGAYRHLTSRDPNVFWTSGQWMTEKTGGSDVSNTETIAVNEKGSYRLYGSKWFTSATTSQMAMTLARIADENGKTLPGSRGLSLFYLETHKADGSLNQIEIHRLKDKLGTRALPTAELTLNGTPAKLVGEPGNGVKNISTLFNITRIYNAVCSVSFMRRGIALARSYGTKRKAFGSFLRDLPLYVETLASLQSDFEACFQLTFYTSLLLGKTECGEGSPEDDAVLRLLTPLAKLYTAKQSIKCSSEVLECFGGAGYVEDTGLPFLLKESQVLAIWEGTTNVLSLDALRAIQKNDAFRPFISNIKTRLSTVKHTALKNSVEKVKETTIHIIKSMETLATQDSAILQGSTRDLAWIMAQTFAASLMLEHADWCLNHSHKSTAPASAIRWIETNLTLPKAKDHSWLKHSQEIAFS